MDELRNLQQIYNAAAIRFNDYDGKDFVLPQAFKDQVKEIYSSKITFNDYSAIIVTSTGQNIFLPNQWFYIASYFTDLYNELLKYKEYALKVISRDRLKELKGGQLSNVEDVLLNNLPLSNESKSNLSRFITDYDWWYGAKTIDRGDFYVSPILSSARLVNVTQSYIADLCAFLADKQDLVNMIIAGVDDKEDTIFNEYTITYAPLQQIFYGAPGTGKSHEVKKYTEAAEKEGRVFRTTFHPDSDYSTFVGCYKPTMTVVPKTTLIGTKVVEVENGAPEEKITYRFTPQTFTNAYVKAWSTEEPVFLVIEEINRGNCAQIFGDLFQLLDRGADGTSEYPVDADTDLANHIGKSLATSTREDFPAGVKEGTRLVLPKNLYIWATMNTSDQSLFPIDSAFKRRWDWRYMPIEDAAKGWKTAVNGNEYDWYRFLEAINKEVLELTHSEDKQLGYFFAKAKDNRIDAQTLVNKVYFYLWTDVFKDYDYENQKAFKKAGGNETIAFKDFFTHGGVDEAMAEQVLINLGLAPENTTSE